MSEGVRIEIPVHFDLWMRGAREGVITSVKRDGTWMVKMDHPQVKRRVQITERDKEYCRILR